MAKYQQGFSVNSNGEIVVSGTNQAVVGTLPIDYLPVDDSGGLKLGNVATLTTQNQSPQIMLRTHIGRFARNLEAAGAVINGSSDDSPAWNTAFAQVVSEGKRVNITLPDEIAGATSAINDEILIDVSYTSVDFGKTTFFAGGLSSGGAIHLTGSNTVPYKQSIAKVQGFEIVGSGKDNTAMAGILLSGGAVAGPNRVAISDFVITACGDGILHKNSSYAEAISHGAVYQCGNGIRFYGASSNAGELPSYHKLACFQNYIGVNSEGSHGTWLSFNQSNFDHNDRQFSVIGKSKVRLIGCHMENYDEAAALIYVAGDGSTFVMDGGEIVITNDGARTLPYIVDCTANQGFGGAYFNFVDFYKTWTNTGYFSTGAGITQVNGYTTISDRRQCILLNSVLNRCVDGGFEASSVNDIVQIYKDTTGITSRLTGTNIVITQGTTAPRTGSKYLQAAKAGAAATSAGYYIVVPITNTAQRGTFRAFFRKTASGSVSINPVYCKLNAGSSAGTYQHVQTGGSDPAKTFSDTSGNWIEVKSQDYGIKPASAYPWATHYGLFIDMTNMGAGNLDLDDLEIALM